MGVLLDGSGAGNTIGGTTAATRNIISGATFANIEDRNGANNTLIEGNYIGTDATGTQALGGATGIQVLASGVTIGGTVAGAATSSPGITVLGSRSRTAQCLRCPITSATTWSRATLSARNVTGTQALPNQGNGIRIANSDDNTIGGTTGTIGLLGSVGFAGNLISGNTVSAGCGVGLQCGRYPRLAEQPDRWQLHRHQRRRHRRLGNTGGGVAIDAGSNSNTIGGTTAAAANVISGNSAYGITVDVATGNLLENNDVGTQAGGSGSVPNTSGALEITNGAAVAVAGSFTGNVVNQGSLSTFNGPAVVSITGNYTQSSAGILNMQVAGTSAGSGYDQLNVSSSATLGGTLNVNLLGSFAPAGGSSYSVLTFGSSSGSFGTTNLPSTGSGNHFVALTGPAALTLWNVPTTTTEFWASPVSGNWSTAGSWSTGTTPIATDQVYVGTNVTVTHSTGTDTISSLTTNGGLVLSGGTLTVNGSLQATTPVTLSGGTLANANVVSGTTLTATSGGGTLSAVTLNGTLDMGSNNGAAVTVTNGLTLNNAIALGSGTNHGVLTFSGTQTVGGNGSITFGASTANQIIVSGGTTTFGSNVLIHGQNGTISSTSNGNFVNQGTIAADVAGGTLTITVSGWFNAYLVEGLNGGTLNLASPWTNNSTLSANVVADAVSTVEFNGNITNSGYTLGLSGAGSFQLGSAGSGVTIMGGTITTSNGAELDVLSVPSADTLDGLTLAGTLDLFASDGVTLDVIDNLILTGLIKIGNSSHYGVLQFSGAAQNLSGTGSIVFGSSSTDSIYTGAGLTIGSGITIHGQNGYIGYNPNYSIQAGNTFTNQGTIDADVAGGRITLLGANWSSSGKLRADNGATLNLSGTWSNTGLIAASASTLNLGNLNGTFSLGSASTYNIVNSTVTIGGTLNNTGSTLALNALTGSWNVGNGGEILGGTVSTSASAVLRGNSISLGGGDLDGVTLAGTLDLSQSAFGDIQVSDGLTLSGGTILIGTAGDTVNWGDLSFIGSTPQTLGGSGTVLFGGSVGGCRGDLAGACAR